MINTSFIPSIRKASLENSDEISHSRRRRALSGLRQPALRLCPDPVSALPGQASADVFLQDSRVLSLLPRQAAGGVGRRERNIFKLWRFHERGETLRLTDDFRVDCIDDPAGRPLSRPSPLS
jgi:hypothetical protein